MRIAIIPIDNRPVCYALTQEIAKIDGALELFLPDKKLLGGLRSTADVEGILAWLEGLEKVDAMIISLDTIAYGGLISSRRCNDSFEEIQSRLENFREKCKDKCDGNIYAFSSIMRISNNNINEEEKEYWIDFGKKIFEYSYNFHREGTDVSDVPEDILNNYLATRRRNFEINKMYLNWLEEGFLDTLVFSKDDCAQFGFNVLESEILKRMAAEKGLSAMVKTGADEIPLTLFARAICSLNNQEVKICKKFLAPEHKELISNYEDISIEKSAQAQIELGAKCWDKNISEKEADIVLLINNFEEKQGEIVMGIPTKPFNGKIDLPQKPFIIADVRLANGSDNEFIKKLFKKKLDFKTFYGYSGWNTSANTLGSLICAAVVRFFAKEYSEEAFKRVQMIRFLDDWAYQANVRQALKKVIQKPDVRKIKKLMLPFEKKVNKILKTKFDIKYKFPWKRFFEISVVVEN